ncbi:MAG: sulfatase-like hydrolase/transferase, partial [Spirochaetia bacterium]|nr:sulfatase-like hydrolase/transferase [Spirochaetia bacterium]
LQTKTSFWDREKLIRNTRGYYALISLLDHEFGRILATLERLGLRDNTIIVYTSDHGDMLGSQNLTHKQLPFREAANVPLLVSWKGKTWTGVNEECLGLADLPVSLMSLLGLQFGSKRDGENLGALFTDPKARGKEAVPIFDLVPAHQAEDRGGFEWAGLKTKTHTFAKKSDGSPWLLFDDARDPFQLKNLAADASHSQTLQKFSSDTDKALKQHDFAFGPWKDTIRNLGLVDVWNKSQAYFKRASI